MESELKPVCEAQDELRLPGFKISWKVLASHNGAMTERDKKFGLWAQFPAQTAEK